MTTETTTTTTAADKPWYDGVITDPAEIGSVQNRGWDKLTPQAAAAAAVKAHREAERYIGVSPDKLVRLPEATDEAGWKTVYQRLGAPKEAKDYDPAITSVKHADGSALDQPLVDTIRGIAATNNLTVAQATAVAKGLVSASEKSVAATVAETQAKVQEERALLAKNWGANAEVNAIVAKNAAQKLGVPADAIATLENQVGYKAVMEMFLKIGQSIGEDKFIRDTNTGGGGNMLTKEQALSRRQELIHDADWSKRYLAGGVAERRELESLIRIERA